MRNDKLIRSNLSSTESKWFAIYCKYKCEKLVCERLEKKDIIAYVPLITETKQYTRKVKTYHKPLFNCYAFVKIRKQDYVKVLETEHVFHFLKINRELIAIPEEEISILKRVVGEVNDLEIVQDFVEGMEVEVISGNLTGLKGRLVEANNNRNFLIELDHIGFQLRIEIKPTHLSPVRKSTPTLASF